MVYYFYSLVFLFGCFVGSFLTVVIDRVPKNETIVRGRSHCDHCRHKLAWYDLMPVLSYIMLGGKCRYCGVRLSSYYPFIELLTGVMFVAAIYHIFYNSVLTFIDPLYAFATLYVLYLISVLIIITFTDLKYGIIPFVVVIPAIIISLFWHALAAFLHISVIGVTNYSFVNYLFSGLGSAGFFLLLFLLTKGRGMGFGDVVYVLFMGFLLGFPLVILGLYIAFLSGAIISLVLVLLKKKKFKGESIPFGPFLVLGTCIALLWGQQIFTKILASVLPF